MKWILNVPIMELKEGPSRKKTRIAIARSFVVVKDRPSLEGYKEKIVKKKSCN